MNIIFSERLKKLRLNAELSIRNLSKILGVSHVTYLHWEQAKTEPNIDMILTICDFFNVSPSYMLGREDTTVSTINSHNSNNTSVSIGGSVSGNVAIGNNVFVGDKKDTKKS